MLDVAEIWWIIAAMAVGTYLIRFSFLGLVGNRKMPPFLLRLLRYTPVAVLPGMVAPIALWPAATGGEIDGPRLVAALATLAAGIWSRNMFVAIGAGASVLYLGLWITAG